MEYIFDNERPIYIQLVELIKAEIISGRLKQGEKIPSVREMALNAKVNPNTVQKALAELERDKLIYTERTNGKFVTTDKNIIKKFKADIINEKVGCFVADMKNIGISTDEIVEYLQKEERNG